MVRKAKEKEDVRHQTGSYGQDFLEHHQHRPKDKIDAWKAALTHVGELSGFVSQEFRLCLINQNEVKGEVERKRNTDW
ncbi:hypothetical protein P8452_34252 [Trifolium repens]|nr:hypothetical protein P8452_34252 [Trifolium repens]